MSFQPVSVRGVNDNLCSSESDSSIEHRKSYAACAVKRFFTSSVIILSKNGASIGIFGTRHCVVRQKYGQMPSEHITYVKCRNKTVSKACYVKSIRVIVVFTRIDVLWMQPWWRAVGISARQPFHVLWKYHWHIEVYYTIAHLIVREVVVTPLLSGLAYFCDKGGGVVIHYHITNLDVLFLGYIKECRNEQRDQRTRWIMFRSWRNTRPCRIYLCQRNCWGHSQPDYLEQLLHCAYRFLVRFHPRIKG